MDGKIYNVLLVYCAEYTCSAPDTRLGYGSPGYMYVCTECRRDYFWGDAMLTVSISVCVGTILLYPSPTIHVYDCTEKSLVETITSRWQYYGDNIEISPVSPWEIRTILIIGLHESCVVFLRSQHIVMKFRLVYATNRNQLSCCECAWACTTSVNKLTISHYVCMCNYACPRYLSPSES